MNLLALSGGTAGPGNAAEAVRPQARVERLSPFTQILIEQVEIEGTTELSEEALSEFVAPLIGREVGFIDILAFRDRVTDLYRARGYVTSRAVLPDQDITEGRLRLAVVEGRVGRIEIDGLTHLRPDYVRARLEPERGRVLNVQHIERAIRLLLKDPQLSSVDIRIMAGLRDGEADLMVTVREAQRWGGSVAFANDQVPAIGSNRLEFSGFFRDVTGFGDTLGLRFSKVTEGEAEQGGIAISVPVSAMGDTTLGFRFDRSRARVIDPAFKALDIESRSDSYDLSLNHLVYQDESQRASLGGIVSLRQSESFLLGFPFDFTQGTEDGRTRLTILRLYQEWSRQFPDQAVALRSQVSVGLPFFDATRTGLEPDAEFVSWLGQAQYARRLWAGDLNLRLTLQLTNSPLFGLEQIAIGGVGTVRGYRENTIVRDQGAVFSASYLYPLFRLSEDNDGDGGGYLRLGPFFDHGRGWNQGGGTPRPHTLSSIGLALDWSPLNWLNLTLAYGVPLNRLPTPREDLQDRGIHFRLTTRLP